MSDPKVQFQLKGWQAGVALVVVSLFFLFRISTATDSLSEEGARELRIWLVAEYTRAMLPDLKKGVEARDNKAVQEQVGNLVRYSDVTFPFMKARRKRGDRYIVKVEVEVKGGPPPTGEAVRYFEMSHSMLIGWRYERDTTKLSWWLAMI